MTGDSDQNIEPEWLRKLPLRSEEPGFSPDQLIKCEACGKANAPNRVACLYCGAGIHGTTITRFDIEVPESWENGYNIILGDTPDAELEPAAIQIASMLGAETETVSTILAEGGGLPLARVKKESQAAAVSAKLAEFEIKSMIVADESLHAASAPTRLRSITFEGNSIRLELFNRGRFELLESSELMLVIPGVLLQGKTESVERRKRRGTKTLREAEMSSDEPVLDIYSVREPNGWRIRASGFDFSCLDADKSLIVGENMKKLTAKLIEFSPTTRVIADYSKISSILEYAWPSESRRDTLALGLNRKEVSNVFTTNNTLQFNRYSRLQWQLYEKEL
ncbi:MAG: hypothetical protein ABI646_07235 [Acidobacteriota bacterium]